MSYCGLEKERYLGDPTKNSMVGYSFQVTDAEMKCLISSKPGPRSGGVTVGDSGNHVEMVDKKGYVVCRARRLQDGSGWWIVRRFNSPVINWEEEIIEA